jgi:hypothetical protein
VSEDDDRRGRVEAVATPAGRRTISALDATTRVITQQILRSSEARPTKLASSSEWPVRFPIQTVIFDSEGIDVRKLDAQEASPAAQHRRIAS